MWDLSFPTRHQIPIPSIGNWSLHHWTTREVYFLQSRQLKMSPDMAKCHLGVRGKLSPKIAGRAPFSEQGILCFWRRSFSSKGNTHVAKSVWKDAQHHQSLGKCKAKPQWDPHLTPIRTATMTESEDVSVTNANNLEPLRTAGGNAKWCGQCGGSSKTGKYEPAIPLPGTYLPPN